MGASAISSTFLNPLQLYQKQKLDKPADAAPMARINNNRPKNELIRSPTQQQISESKNNNNKEQVKYLSEIEIKQTTATKVGSCRRLDNKYESYQE